MAFSLFADWVFQQVAAKTSGKSTGTSHWLAVIPDVLSKLDFWMEKMTLISLYCIYIYILMFQKPTIMIHQQGFSSLCSTENWLQFSMFNSKVGLALPTYAWQLEFSAKLQILGSCTSEIRTPKNAGRKWRKKFKSFIDGYLLSLEHLVVDDFHSLCLCISLMDWQTPSHWMAIG